MDASDSGGGGVAAGVGELLWDWDNLLNFAIQNDDPLVLPWDNPLGIDADPTEGALLPAPSPPQPVDAEPVPQPPPPPVEAGGSRRGVRKRDPRLVCPNYLAGIVPCACPELDEMAAAAEVEEVAAEMLAGPRKKSKAAIRGSRAAAKIGGGSGVAGRGGAVEMKCQVPGCEADIRELKGYHKRHRVCLRCAHASAVMLDGVQKRYCQQCGKFHVLLDFDEDKRSCRRKLERHNKRRRRKPDSKDTLEKETDEQLDLSTDGSGGRELREEDIDGATCNMLETVHSNKVLDRETPVGSEDLLSSPTCTQTSLQNDQSKSIVTFAASVEACIGTKQENAKLTSSPMHDTKSTYSSSDAFRSSCTTGILQNFLGVYVTKYLSGCLAPPTPTRRRRDTTSSSPPRRRRDTNAYASPDARRGRPRPLHRLPRPLQQPPSLPNGAVLLRELLLPSASCASSTSPRPPVPCFSSPGTRSPSDDEPDSPSNALFVAGARAMISAASTGDEVAFSTASAQIEASRPPGPQWLPAPGHAPPTSSATSSLSCKITASATPLILVLFIRFSLS